MPRLIAIWWVVLFAATGLGADEPLVWLSQFQQALGVVAIDPGLYIFGQVQ